MQGQPEQEEQQQGQEKSHSAKAREREVMDGGSEISRTSARSHSALQLPGCSRPEDGEVLYLERSLLHNTWTDAQQPRGEG